METYSALNIAKYDPSSHTKPSNASETKASDLYNNSMTEDKPCNSQLGPSLELRPLPHPGDDLSTVSRGCQLPRQMQHRVSTPSERDVDSVLADERRWRGEFNNECTSEIDQITVGNGGHGNVERWNALREAASHMHLESFSVELAIEIGATAGESASGNVHDERGCEVVTVSLSRPVRNINDIYIQI